MLLIIGGGIAAYRSLELIRALKKRGLAVRCILTAAAQQSAIDYNVFEGVEVTGLPRFVFSRGELAIQESDVQAKPGHGEFVAREPNAAVNRALSTWKETIAPRRVERTGIPATGV